MAKKPNYKSSVSVSIDDSLLKASKELGINRSEFAQMGLLEAVLIKIESLNTTQKERYRKMLTHLTP